MLHPHKLPLIIPPFVRAQVRLPCSPALSCQSSDSLADSFQALGDVSMPARGRPCQIALSFADDEMVAARTRTQKLGEPEEYGDKARSGFAVSGGPHCAKFPTLSSGMLAANVPGSPCRRFGGCL